MTYKFVAPSRADNFKGLGLTDWLVSVCRSLGMTRPTHVQQGCVPEILAGRDVIGLAQTGSGKTAAFALPILQKLAKDPYGVFALVLVPTRYAQLRTLTRWFCICYLKRQCAYLLYLDKNTHTDAHTYTHTHTHTHTQVNAICHTSVPTGS